MHWRGLLHVDTALGDDKKAKNRKVGVMFSVCLYCFRLCATDAPDKTVGPFRGAFILQEGNQSNESVAKQAKEWLLSILPRTSLHSLTIFPHSISTLTWSRCAGHDGTGGDVLVMMCWS